MAFERITVDPARMGGLPTIRDTRVTVGMVIGQLAGGQGIDQLLEDYPYLEREDVLAALEPAARHRLQHRLNERCRGSGTRFRAEHLPSRGKLIVRQCDDLRRVLRIDRQAGMGRGDDEPAVDSAQAEVHLITDL